MAKGRALERLLRIRTVFDEKGVLGGIKALGGLKAAVGLLAVAFVNMANEAFDAFTKADRAAREANSKFVGYSKETREEIKVTARYLSDEYNVAVTDVIKVYDELGGAGVDLADAHGAVEEILKGVRGGFADVESVAKIAITAIKGFGLSFDDLPQIMDQVVQAVDDGIVPMEQIGHALANVAPQAKIAGVGIDEVLAAVVFLTQKGFDSARSMTLMNRWLATLRDSSNKTGAAFEELAGKSFDEFIAEGGTVADALELIDGYLEETGLSAAEFYTLIQAQRFGEAFQGETDKFREGTETIANATGTVEARVEEAMGGVQEAVTDVDTEVGITMERIGKSVGDIILPFAQATSGIFGFINNLLGVNKPARQAAEDIDFLRSIMDKWDFTITETRERINLLLDTQNGWVRSSDDVELALTQIDLLMSRGLVPTFEAGVFLINDMVLANRDWKNTVTVTDEAQRQQNEGIDDLITLAGEAGIGLSAFTDESEKHAAATLSQNAAIDGFIESTGEVPTALESAIAAIELAEAAAVTHRKTVDAMAEHYSKLATNIMISVDALLAGAVAWDELTIAQQANEQLGLSNVPTAPGSGGTGRPSANVPEDGDPQNSGNQDPTQWSGGGFR